MADRRDPAVYTIPPHRAFADALVAGLLSLHGKDRFGLARGTILLPNNRAVQALSDAFVRRAEGGLLMPRLVAIGDPELDDRTGAMLDALDGDPVPPAVDPLHRQLILARLIQAQRDVDAAEAMRLAADLGRVLDQLHVEEVDPGRLRDPELAKPLSEHWQVSLRQLAVILNQWPAELERLGAIDLADRRNRLLHRVDARWRDAPPPGFVVAAGISTGAKAVATLLRTIARMERGMVIFAGLDLAMPDEEWDAVRGVDARPPVATHPQYHLAHLLDAMGVARAEVQTWRWGSDADARAERSRAISNALAPAAHTSKWIGLPASDKRLGDVRAIELATPADEAQAIALAIREGLENEGTVALVTPDRELARRVSAHLGRWGVAADDSAGRPLSATAPGAFMLALAAVAAEAFAPAALLALLKHPLTMAGDGRLEWLDTVRSLDLALRGPRPAPGLAGIGSFLASGDARERIVRRPAEEWWPTVSALLEPLERTFADSRTAPALLAALRDGAERLAGDGVWTGEAGRALADLFAGLEANAAAGPQAVTPGALLQLLRGVMDTILVRPARGGHPRVFIWGLIEAKLQSANTMILGGLNEGVWPALPSPDPWLAPAIRRTLGLPGLERRIGLSAHDFAGALGAPKVLLTRARRDARAPANASRFWLRLDTMTGGLKPPETRYDLLARALDGSDAPPQRAAQPRPCPPQSARPTAISVTDVDRLAADPYAFYAKAILGLNRLDPVDADPGPGWKGTLIHSVLDDWAKRDNWAPGALVPRMRHALDGPGIHPVIRTLWLPRLIEAAEWTEQCVEEERREGRAPLKSEIAGVVEIAGITLKGRADRIDRAAGGFAIVDYKTGSAPSDRQVREGFALQLGLLGAIAEAGGFEGVAGTAQAFEYWSFARDGDGFGKVTSPAGTRSGKIAPGDFVDHVRGHFERAAARWLTGDDPFEAKLKPDYAYRDYDHLMRLEEWQGRNG
jgi:ATP-dependent helicase/nuclease subunit B